MSGFEFKLQVGVCDFCTTCVIDESIKKKKKKYTESKRKEQYKWMFQFDIPITGINCSFDPNKDFFIL